MLNQESLEQIKSEEQNLVKNNQFKILLASSIVQGECTTVDEICNQFGLTFETALALTTDANFGTMLTKFTKAKASIAFSSEGTNRLIGMMGNDDPKIRLSAIKMLGELAGTLKNKQGDVNVNVNLEQMVKQNETKNITPVENVIREAKQNIVIDLENE